MKGFFGKILEIDLTGRQFRTSPAKDDLLDRYLGGKGLASHLLWRLNPERVPPDAPENRLIFATGPVTGSSVWGSSRYGVFTKSPQTGLYSESYSGGKVPEAVDAAGYDAVVISGKCKEPSLLVISPDGAAFHPAKELWGMDTFATEDAVHERFCTTLPDDYKSGAVVIGPAGENRVSFAVIENDYWRSAGRTGVGAVMGGKLLKAILFTGNKRRVLKDPEGLSRFSKELARSAKEHPVVAAFKSGGTANMVERTSRAKAFPTRYWSQGFMDGWEKISTRALHEECRVSPRACAKCFIACGRMSTVISGRHAGLKIEGPEYETIFAFGGLCMIDDIKEIAYLNDLCDRLGMDTISAGNLCAFAMEASRRKRIDLSLDYGDADGVAALLHQIAGREGVGAVLADGTVKAAQKWNLEDIAVHVKGLELPGYDPRVLKGSALAFSVSDRGACHLRATFHNPELSGLLDPEAVEGKAAHLIGYEDRLTVMDTLILCRFFRTLYPWEKMARILSLTCGIETDAEGLQKRAKDIATLIRRFNLREGLRLEDDCLSKGLFRKDLRGIPPLDEAEVVKMVQDYYRLRGWNSSGRPE